MSMGSAKQARSWMTSIGGELVMSICQRKSIYCFDRIVNALPFVGLQHFPNGYGFKQWTGNNSKALIKVSSKLSLPSFFKF